MFLSRVRIHIYKLNNSGKMRKHKRPRKDLLESQKGKIDTGLLSSSESLTRLSERERKYTSSSSDDDCRKTKKSRGSKGKKKDSSTSTSSSSSSTESSTSSSSSSTSSSDDNRKRKKKNMDILMRKLKQKKEDKRNNRRKKPVEKEVKKKNKTNKSKMEQLEEASNDIPLELMERSKAMAPMRKEEWEKQQNVVKRIYDEETKRHRLIKGDGEVIEEIVSKEKHRAINKQATKGDGEYFSNKLAQSIK